MAVERSLNWISEQRADLSDMRAIESAVRNDFDTLISGFVTGTDMGYVLKGFAISTAGAIGGAANGLQMLVDGSSIFHVTSNLSGTFFTVQPGTLPVTLNSAVNTQVTGAFAPNSINYVGLEYSRFLDPQTAANVYLWNPTSNTEFTITAPRAQILEFNIVITTSSFAANVLPLATVATDGGNNVISITDARNLLFRLGAGGANPDPFHKYPWNAQSEGRVENPSTTTTSASPFEGGDKMLFNLKDWMDAVMTSIAEIKGSEFWYSSGSSVANINLTDLFNDTALSVMTGSGRFKHVTAGLLQWTSPLLITQLTGRRIYTIDANPSGITILDDQVAYISLVRNQDFQSSNSFTVVSGSYTISATTTVVGLSSGDYVKFASDPDSAWREVFSVAGNIITLVNSPEPSYPFSNTSAKLLRSQGDYTLSNVIVANREDVPANGDTYWFAHRKDGPTITATIASPGSSGATRISGVATITTTAPHLLVAGALISISGVSDSSFDGLFTVINITSPTAFTISNNGPDVPAATAGNGSVVNAARIYLRWLGEISQGEMIQIDGQVSADTLIYIGAMSETDSTPAYSSQKYITNGNSLTDTIGTLDNFLYQNHAQDHQLKLIEGGTWTSAQSGGGYTTLASTGSQSSSVVIDNAQDEIGQIFQPSSNISVDRIAISLKANGSPTGIVQAILSLDDGSGNPGASIQVSAPVNATSISSAAFAFYNFDFSPSVPLSSGTNYHVVINSSPAFSGVDYVNVGVDGAGSGIFTNGYQVHNGTWMSPTSNAVALNLQQLNPVTDNISWSSDAYIEIPGLNNTSNTILASSMVLPSNNIAYVTLNRYNNTPTNLTVNISPINSFVPGINDVIIARAVSDGVIVGTHSMKLLLGESKEIDTGVSDQILNSIAALDNADYTGQGRLVANLPSTPKRVAVTPFNKLSQDSTQWAKEVSNLVTNFSGAQIDFSTGTVYAADGSTPLGNNFIPSTIIANQYLWYSITAVVNTVDADNQFTMQIQVLPADSSGTTALNAPKATFTSGIKLGQVLVQDNGSGGSGTILDVLQSNIIQLTSGSADGGTGLTPVTFFDPVSTTLPTGSSVTIDGVAGANNDLVLFNNLSSGNHRIYKLSGVGTSIMWTAQREFNGQLDPLNSNQVIVAKGNSFADQVGTFNGSSWLFNFTVRYFNGADYWEQSALFTTALANNTTGNIFSVTAVGSEHWIIGYSISRGSSTETGHLYIDSDDTNAVVTKSTAYIGDVETSFSAAIVTGNLQLNYTTDNSGPTGSMKFFYQRWSDNAGGPNGVPNYTGSTTGVTSLNILTGAVNLVAGANITITPSGNNLTIASTGGGGGSPAGSNQEVQFNNSGSFGADPNFKYDTGSTSINQNGLFSTALSGSLTILDNQPTDVTLFSYSASSYPDAIMEYSIVRGSTRFTGTAWINTDGSTAQISTLGTPLGGLNGVSLDATFNAGNIDISYTSTSTGSGGTFKYSMRRWS